MGRNRTCNDGTLFFWNDIVEFTIPFFCTLLNTQFKKEFREEKEFNIHEIKKKQDFFLKEEILNNISDFFFFISKILWKNLIYINRK